MKESENLMDELRSIAAASLDKCRSSGSRDWAAIKASIKSDLSNYLFKTTKRNPMDPSRHHGDLNAACAIRAPDAEVSVVRRGGFQVQNNGSGRRTGVRRPACGFAAAGMHADCP